MLFVGQFGSSVSVVKRGLRVEIVFLTIRDSKKVNSTSAIHEMISRDNSQNCV